jgi:hypothetical protein
MEASGIIMVYVQVRTVDHDDVLVAHRFLITSISFRSPRSDRVFASFVP